MRLWPWLVLFGFPNGHRRQYLEQLEGQPNLIELAVGFGNNRQNEKNAAQHSIFGGDSGVAIPKPKLPNCEPYSDIEKLRIEKDVVGFYISGHPLDQFKVEIDNFCSCTVDRTEEFKNQVIRVAGIVVKNNERITKKGNPFGLFSIEDFNGSLDMAMFGEDYMKNRHLIATGSFVYIIGRVEERYNQPGVWEFRPKIIQLLSEIRDELSKELALTVEASLVNDLLVDQLDTLATDNPGKCKMSINVYDIEEQISVELLSKKYLVFPSNSLMKELSNLNGIKHKIISDKIELPKDNRPDYKRFSKT